MNDVKQLLPCPEALAKRFHELYESLAPAFGYETRRESAKPWEQVPINNRQLMISVCTHILDEWNTRPDSAWRAALIHEAPELERLGHDEIWGFFVHWDKIIKACNRAWPSPVGYSQSPIELITRIINERDDLQSSNDSLRKRVEKVEKATELLKKSLRLSSLTHLESEAGHHGRLSKEARYGKQISEIENEIRDFIQSLTLTSHQPEQEEVMQTEAEIRPISSTVGAHPVAGANGSSVTTPLGENNSNPEATNPQNEKES